MGAMKGSKALDVHSQTVLLTPWSAHCHHCHKETYRTELQLVQHDLAAM